MDDRDVVELQIGRPPRSEVIVETRCHLGLPVVTRVPPILDDGTPFPTTHWLTCPLATIRISRIEADGGVRAADEEIAADLDLAEDFERAMDRYRRRRDADIPEGHSGPRPQGGIGGSRGGVKCLHAQYADAASGHDNPIGIRVVAAVEPLNCSEPCIVASASGDGVVFNDRWTEPAAATG